MMDEIERAREIFKTLEKRSINNDADVARRIFFIQDRLNK